VGRAAGGVAAITRPVSLPLIDAIEASGTGWVTCSWLSVSRMPLSTGCLCGFSNAPESTTAAQPAPRGAVEASPPGLRYLHSFDREALSKHTIPGNLDRARGRSTRLPRHGEAAPGCLSEPVSVLRPFLLRRSPLKEKGVWAAAELVPWKRHGSQWKDDRAPFILAIRAVFQHNEKRFFLCESEST
jgi:hypothetical protein